MIECAAEVLVLLMGRGTGKTAILVAKTVLTTMQYPGVKVLWLVPEASAFRKAILPKFRALDAVFRQLYGRPLITKINNSNAYMCLTLISGEIEFQSAKNIEAVRGGEVGLIVIDEGADVDATPDSLAAFLLCLRGYGSQRVYVAGTPKGLQGALGLFLSRANAGDPAVKVFRAASLDNPYQKKETLAFFKRTMSERLYRQEVLGEVMANAGLVYSSFDPAVHIRKEAFNVREALKFKQWDLAVCLDWGSAQAHALWICHRRYPGTNLPEMVAVYEQPFEQTPAISMIKAVMETTKRLYNTRPGCFIVDPEGYSKQIRDYMDGLEIDVVRERDKAKRGITQTIELVQRALGGDGLPVLLTISKECATLDCNGEGGKGIVQHFKNYVYKPKIGSLSNVPFDDNHTCHSGDCNRYAWMNAGKLGYEWENVHFEPEYAYGQ